MNQPPSAPVAPKTPLIAPWLLITAIAVLLIGGGYLIWNYLGQQKTQPSETTETAVPEEAIETPPEPTTEPTDTTATADWKTFTSTTYNYSIKYPSTIITSVLDTESDSGGVVFKGSADTDQVEISILRSDATPDDRKTTLLSFNQVISDSQKTIGNYVWRVIVTNETGAKLHFFSPKLGNGYFEVTGYQSNQTNIENILSTFQFSQ